MNNDFLRAYTIPLLSTTVGETPTPPAVCMQPLEHQPISVLSTSLNRYVAPGKQKPGQEPPITAAPMQRKRKSSTQSNSSTTTYFIGRDPSYPEELNKLIKPLACELCCVQMNSPKSAKAHYESKVHDRKLTAWIAHNYPENPPVIKRFIIEQKSAGPEALHCTICDLPLTSLVHARQHYSGRKHQLVASNVSNPKGAGYYDSEGKWIRTGSKFTPVLENDSRFGIGASFKAAKTNNNSDTEADAQIDKTGSPKYTIPTIPVQDETLCCKICKISVTSAPQMKSHLDGARHRKNLARLSNLPNADSLLMQGEDVSSSNNNAVAKDSLLATVNNKVNSNEDFSMYRTPSGSYYCQYCNMSLSSIAALQQHIQGKKHTKVFSEHKSSQIKSEKTKTM